MTEDFDRTRPTPTDAAPAASELPAGPEMDKRVAREIFGWTTAPDVSPDGRKMYWNAWYDAAGNRQVADSPSTCLPEWSTDAAADYEVLKHVREKWSRRQRNAFDSEVWHLWDARGGYHHTVYEPGDWSRAALAAVKKEAP